MSTVQSWLLVCVPGLVAEGVLGSRSLALSLARSLALSLSLSLFQAFHISLRASVLYVVE